MTNELERTFFDTFGIEPISYVKDFPTREKAASFGRKITGIPKHNKGKFEIGSYTNNIDIFQVHWKEYPQITDSILLELYCLICDYCVIAKLTVDELKQEILRNCIRLQRVVDIKHQVQALFEEG